MFDLNRILTTLNIDPDVNGLQIVDARELAREFFPRLDTDRPALIVNVASAALARSARRTLLVNYPATHSITRLNGATSEEKTLNNFARAAKWTRATVLYLPPLSRPSSPQSLAGIVARLRAPKGCPWDREQTHASLRRALIEEMYEVIEAIDENDPVKLREELGDLLLHVLFQTQIARDRNEFTFADVGAELAAKLIRRHPHVFGDVRVSGAQEVLQNWERIKREEKKTVGALRVAPLDADIPRELPALIRAQKVAKRARGGGRSENGQRESDAWVQKITRGKNRERVLGEVLFALARAAEENGLDAESALREATARIVQKM
jgi:tetrapyrrole methylase family protein/MazG family protein